MRASRCRRRATSTGCPSRARSRRRRRPTTYADAARAALGPALAGRRAREEPGGVVTLSAEKGYSRETGNLIFHVALLCALVLIAVGRLYSYQGSAIVEQGTGFCNTVSQYDSWRPGRFAAEGKVAPGAVLHRRADASSPPTYTAAGEPTQFARRRHATGRPWTPTPQRTTIKVNHPLRLEGDRVYLISHGFAPQVTSACPTARCATTPQAFIPTERRRRCSPRARSRSRASRRQAGHRHRGLLRPDPGRRRADGDRSRSASPQVRQPGAGHLRLHAATSTRPDRAVGVLARHVEDEADRHGEPARSGRR